MLICYALEKRSTWFILGFAVSCALGSAYVAVRPRRGDLVGGRRAQVVGGGAGAQGIANVV
jgi:hypothetical protein